MAIDFHANLEIWYSHKDRKTARKVDLHEERTYTFYDFKDEWKRRGGLVDMMNYESLVTTTNLEKSTDARMWMVSMKH